ncbi:unnamed protein product [Agarophyton chilense]
MPFRHIALLMLLLLSCPTANARRSDTVLKSWLGRFVRPSSRPSHVRRSLAESNDQEDPPESHASIEDLRSRIAEHHIKMSRMEQETKDLAHEKDYLEKSLELKKGQTNMQDGQVKLSQAALEEQGKEIEMYRREAPRTLQRYNELIRRQRQLQQTLTRLHRQSEELSTTKNVIMNKIHNLTVGDLVEHHARALPDAMAGALRKGAAALVPFLDYLVIAADTNNRLVDHVGSEIDKYTHVNISSSPFLSGILFYCVLLVPLLTIFSIFKRILDTSTKVTVSTCLFVGNVYFILMCAFSVMASLILRQDPLRIWSKRYETSFVIANLLLAAYFMWHVAMLALQTALCFDRRNLSQFVATVTVGIHYFLFAWRKVFTDAPPVMYTFNYMMYATIFGFVLYERYSRMSSRQVNDNGIIRLVDSVVRSVGSTLGDVQQLQRFAKHFFESLTDQGLASRRSTRRHVRIDESVKHKYRSERGDRLTNKKVSLTDSEHSDDEEQGDLSHRRSRGGGITSHSKKGKSHVSQKEDKASSGFISLLFGNGGEDESSTSEEDDIEPKRKFWRVFGTDKSRKCRRALEARPPPKTHNRHRDKKINHAPRLSMWKWS